MLIAKHTVILFKNKPHIILEGTNATKNFPLAPPFRDERDFHFSLGTKLRDERE